MCSFGPPSVETCTPYSGQPTSPVRCLSIDALSLPRFSRAQLIAHTQVCQDRPRCKVTVAVAIPACGFFSFQLTPSSESFRLHYHSIPASSQAQPLQVWSVLRSRAGLADRQHGESLLLLLSTRCHTHTDQSCTGYGCRLLVLCYNLFSQRPGLFPLLPCSALQCALSCQPCPQPRRAKPILPRRAGSSSIFNHFQCACQQQLPVPCDPVQW